MILSSKVASTLVPAFNFTPLSLGIDIAQRLHAHLQPESDPERAFARARALQFHFIRVPVYTDENLRKRNVLLRVEILRELLIAEHLVANQNALARINSAEPATHQRPSAHRHVLAAIIFQQNQIVIAERHQPIVVVQVLDRHVGLSVCSERERFQR